MSSKSGASALLQELSSISQSINQASDSLTDNIVEFESVLNRLRLGVEANVNLLKKTEERDEGVFLHTVTYRESLEYCKHRGKWGLYIADFYEEDVDSSNPDTYHLTPLKDCSREQRFMAVEKFPELLQVLAKNGKEFAEKVAQNAARVKTIAGTLKS